jgi:hypothetical protein
VRAVLSTYTQITADQSKALVLPKWRPTSTRPRSPSSVTCPSSTVC